MSGTSTLIAPGARTTRVRDERPAPPRWRAAGLWRLLALRIMAPVCALWLEGWPALVGVLVVQEAGLWLAPRLATRSRLAASLYLGAFALRAGVAISLHAVQKAAGNADGAVFQDDATYDLVGAWLVRIGHGDGIAIFPGHKHLLDGLYPYLIGGIYALLGYTPLVPKLLNAALAALGAVLVMELGRRAFGPTVGSVAGVGFAVLPTLVVYSSVTLKEPLLLFAVLVSLRALQELGAAPVRSAAFANAAMPLLVGMALVDDLRTPMVLIVLGLVAVTFLRRSRGRRDLAYLAVAGVVLAGLLAGGVVLVRGAAPGSAIADATHLDYLALQLHHRRAWEAASARSQIGAQADPFTPEGDRVPLGDDADSFSLVGDVLSPVAFALLSPAPWQVRSLRDLAASAEMLVWYALLAAACLVPIVRPKQTWFVLCLLVYGVTTWLLLAVSEGNLGNLLRHRMMLTPTVLVLGSAGAVWLWPRLVAVVPPLRQLAAGWPRTVGPSPTD